MQQGETTAIRQDFRSEVTAGRFEIASIDHAAVLYSVPFNPRTNQPIRASRSAESSSFSEPSVGSRNVPATMFRMISRNRFR